MLLVGYFLLETWGRGQEQLQFERYLKLFPSFPSADFRNYTIGCLERHYNVDNWEDIAPPRTCIHNTHYFLNQYFVHRYNQSKQLNHSELVQLSPTFPDRDSYITLRHFINSNHWGYTTKQHVVKNNSVVRNCQYRVHLSTRKGPHSGVHSFFSHLLRLPYDLVFDIYQSSCLYSFSNWIYGGSSFTTIALSPLIHLDCEWLDWQSDRYHFSCGMYFDQYAYSNYQHNPSHLYYTQEVLSLNSQDLHVNETTLCFRLVHLLDYEGYRAYSEVNQLPMGEILHAQMVCVPYDPNNSRKAMDLSPLRHLHPSPNALMPSIPTNQPPMFSSLTAYDSGYPRIQQCLSTQPVYMVGASHVRYLWDEFLLHYFDGRSELLKIPAHHADEFIQGTSYYYYRNYFLWTIPRTLEAFCVGIEQNITSAMGRNDDVLNHTDSTWWRTANLTYLREVITPIQVILQGGAWDHHFFTPRAIQFHLNGIFDQVTSLARRPCSLFLSLHFMTTVPIPLCAYNAHLYSSMYPTLKGCSDRGNRNNAAMKAIAQQLLEGIQSISYPHLSLVKWAQRGSALTASHRNTPPLPPQQIR